MLAQAGLVDVNVNRRLSQFHVVVNTQKIHVTRRLACWRAGWGFIRNRRNGNAAVYLLQQLGFASDEAPLRFAAPLGNILFNTTAVLVSMTL